MRKNYQIVVDKDKGDCMRACLTSMLGLPNDPKKIPLGGADDWFPKCYRFLRRFGMDIRYEEKSCWRSGLWMASVKSKNYSGRTHAIVMDGHKVLWDPSPKKRYRTGTRLLGTDIVLGGHSLEVLDPSKLYKLGEFRKKCR